ncbi:MAG: tRNA (N(6)-L-threonylcarbamoyladenosine(37)-C(2))-methylthiotransferase MtaB [Chloroflexi bacterium]|nr:tRNA (N(6)-L-threonylcarbamoyladenosine(37)-C(2))-methylthiotransferase MtaB [Chloroflexota bacterium]
MISGRAVDRMLGRRICTASVVTLGCKLNQAESYRLQVDLAQAGVDLLPFGQPVDLSIVNTCTITHVADQQARQMLRRARRISPDGCVVAMGCYAQIAPDEVAAIEGVDMVVTAEKERLVAQLQSAGMMLGDGSDGVNGNIGPDHLHPLPETRVRRFVKIQDGCDDYCTYCIVPFARGHSISRPSEAIVAEVRELEADGCREVVLTGVQIGAYGRDRYRFREADLPPPGRPLGSLVQRLLAETTIPRIRISSIQPQDWPQDFLDLFQDARLCRHLHLPLQAGCDATLRRMSRRYTTDDFAQLVERIRVALPDVAITGDMIVGFPGETEEQHAESLRFARAIGFADLHVFRYSPRRGTAASRMAGQVNPDTKKHRSEELRALAEESAHVFRGQFLGSRHQVLWEEQLPAADGPPRWTGLTGNYLRVVRASAEDLLGRETDETLAHLRDGVFGPEAR